MSTNPVISPKTILLVEDEGLVLLSLQMALEEFGYEVIAAVNGQDALHKYALHKDKIELVVTDMSMPGINGMDLLAALRTQSPELKIILMTGHWLDTDKLTPPLHMPTRHIMKPLSLNNLIQIIEQTLA